MRFFIHANVEICCSCSTNLIIWSGCLTFSDHSWNVTAIRHAIVGKHCHNNWTVCPLSSRIYLTVTSCWFISSDSNSSHWRTCQWSLMIGRRHCCCFGICCLVFLVLVRCGFCFSSFYELSQRRKHWLRKRIATKNTGRCCVLLPRAFYNDCSNLTFELTLASLFGVNFPWLTVFLKA